MKKLIFLTLLFMSIVFASVDGTVHLMFNNGNVTTSAENTYYEFDVQVYISGTVNANDLYLGDGMVYVKYNTDIFGSLIAGSENLVVEKKGILDSPFYEITESNNTTSDIFGFAFSALLTGQDRGYYSKVSNDSSNPSHILRIKMKAKASGSGEVQFPTTIPIDDIFWTLDNHAYSGGLDISMASENVFIKGPVTGEPYTSIELESLDAVYKGGMVRMKWKTASETENLGFIIKRAVVGGSGQTGIYEEIDSYTDNEQLEGAGTTDNNTSYVYFDKTVKPGMKYAYVLQDVDYEGHIRESEALMVNIPENRVIQSDEFVFSSGYPNPFNPYFIVPFELYSPQSVDIRLYDVSGRQIKVIADREFSAGQYDLLVDGSNLSSGTYFLRARIDNKVKTQKMLLVK